MWTEFEMSWKQRFSAPFDGWCISVPSVCMAFREVPTSTNRALWFPGRKTPNITTKTEGEKLALNYNSSEMAVTAIRAAGVYGPNDRTTTLQLVPAFLSRRFGYVNGGRHIMAPVYIDNLVQMIKLAADGRLTYPELASLINKKIILLPLGMLKVLANIGKWLRLSPVGAKTLNFISNPVIIDPANFNRRFNFTPQYDTKQAMKQFSETK